MEVLNKNQRRSALLRMLILGTLILILLSLTMCNIERQYAGQGKEDVARLQRELTDTKNELMGEVSRYKKEAEGLRKDLVACQENSGEEDPRVAQLQEKLEDEKTKYEILEDKKELCDERLDACKSDLAAAKSFK